MRPAGWKLFGHAMFELSQLNVTEVAEFVQRNFQNLFTKGAPPGKQIRVLFVERWCGASFTCKRRAASVPSSNAVQRPGFNFRVGDKTAGVFVGFLQPRLNQAVLRRTLPFSHEGIGW